MRIRNCSPASSKPEPTASPQRTPLRRSCIDAVIAIHNGSTYVDPRVGTHSAERGGSARRIRTLNGLSARETEVLRLIADGYSNREISIALSLSEKTIKNHISRIFAKLHITARTQAVIHAIKNGIA